LQLTTALGYTKALPGRMIGIPVRRKHTVCSGQSCLKKHRNKLLVDPDGRPKDQKTAGFSSKSQFYAGKSGTEPSNSKVACRAPSEAGNTHGSIDREFEFDGSKIV
jgi:hypothetical protein